LLTNVIRNTSITLAIDDEQTLQCERGVLAVRTPAMNTHTVSLFPHALREVVVLGIVRGALCLVPVGVWVYDIRD
jgi:hypothetical protein